MRAISLNLGLNPRETDIVIVVKSATWYQNFTRCASDWIMALTPGGVDQDLERLGYQRIKRPMFPLDEDMEDPDLSAVFIASSDAD
jgi:microcystin degradation protein MlrC